MMGSLVDRLRQLAESLPAHGFVQLDRAALLEFVEDADETAAPASEPAATWRALIWTADASARLNVREAAEALGRSVSWIYRRTAPSARAGKYGTRDRIPFDKLENGELVVTAGRLRDWIRERERASA